MSAMPASRRTRRWPTSPCCWRSAGSELGHIAKIVVYLTDIRYREAVYRSMGKWLKGVFPCSTGLVVTALARPEWVVEIDATAVIPEGYKPKKKSEEMTFSIAARCVDTGMFGIAVSSSSPAVAARCAHARAGVGAFGTQNITDPRLGPQGLDLMAKGASAEQAIATLKQSAPHIAFRQLIAVDANGKAAAHSGDHTLGTHATAQALNVVAAGNLLRDEEIPAKMVAAFQRAQGHLGGTAADGDGGGDCCRRRRGTGALRRPADRARRALAGRRSARRLVRWRSDRGAAETVGHLQAAAGGLRHARAQSHGAPSFGVPGDK